MHRFLFRLGRGAARRHWVVIDNDSVPGSSSQQGLDVLEAQFPSQAGMQELRHNLDLDPAAEPRAGGNATAIARRSISCGYRAEI